MYGKENKKELNKKKGIINDGWRHWARFESGAHAYIELRDSMIAEEILHSRKRDNQEIHHRVALIYLQPWTGFVDNTTENTSAYIARVRRAYNEGRIDQFIVAEMRFPNDPQPIVHEFDRAAMYQRAKELGMITEVSTAG